jgi:hypothetical protein
MKRVLVGQEESVQELPVVVPCQWAGERDCLVGPFSSKGVAETFAERFAITFVALSTEPILARHDSWYVAIAA